MRILGLICVTVGLAIVIFSFAIATAWSPAAKALCSGFYLVRCGQSRIAWIEILFGLGMAGLGCILLALQPHRKK
jgi:hypothetical protein